MSIVSTLNPRKRLEPKSEHAPLSTDSDRLFTHSQDELYLSSVPYIDGEVWETNAYYRQRESHNAPTDHYDVHQSSINQAFEKILNYPIYLKDAVEYENDKESNTKGLKGVGFVHSGVVPSIGDMFTANTGSVEESVFQVYGSEKLAADKRSLYVISFQLYDDVDKETLAALESKVYKTYHYVKDRLKYNKLPLVTKEEYSRLNTLEELQAKLQVFYHNRFYDNRNKIYKTIFLTDKDVTTWYYDAWVNNFVIALGIRPNLAAYAVRHNGDDENYVNLWDVLEKREYEHLEACMQTAKVAQRKVYTGHWLSDHVSSLIGLTHYLTFDKDTLEDSVILEQYEGENLLSEVNEYYSLVSFKPYLFNDEFYQGVAKTLFEKTIHDGLKNKSLLIDNLALLSKEIFNLTKLQQYYFIPILLLLLHLRKGD